MILQLLRALIAAVQISHGNRPNSPCNTTNHGIFRIQPIGEEERQIWCKFIDIHASASIIFDVGETICKCECELTNRVGARLSDVISRNADRVVVSNSLVNVVLLHIPHQFETKLSGENASILCLVLFEDVCLHRSTNRL